MSKAEWANTVLLTIAAITTGLLGWAVVHLLKLIWQTRARKQGGLHHADPPNTTRI